MPLSPIREITTFEVQSIQADFLGSHAGDDSGEIDLNFAGRQTQYSTHAIHPYVAAMNPPLASTLINRYVPRGARVLDAFCGGGGILVECILNGRQATGYDVNPLAALISSVKTTYLPVSLTLPEYCHILERAHKLLDVSTDDVPKLIQFWYNEESLTCLRALQLAIEQIENLPVRNLFQVALSATARDVMLTYRGEIRLRKLTGVDLERFRPQVIQVFCRRAETAMARIASLPEGSVAEVALCDVRKIPSDQEYHTVLTSPPYADDTNGVGYFQFSRNMMYWLGLSLDEQKLYRRTFLGCGYQGEQVEQPPSETLDKTLRILIERNKTHYRQAFAFYKDYYEALRQITYVTNSRVIIVIGDRVLSRLQINNGNITKEFLEELGFGLEHYYTRQLKQKRIANLGGDGGGTSIEHVLVHHR